MRHEHGRKGDQEGRRMTFLNKKEEVIDLILTVKGREKYSRGKLRPLYYQFYDDEIIYDIRHAQTASFEGQNEIVPRIQDMVVLKNQSCWQGPVNGLNGKTFEIEKEPFFYEMGESDPFSQYKPAWEVTAIKGKTTGSVGFVPLEKNIAALNDYQGEKIPQFNVRCDYNVYVKTTEAQEVEAIYYDRTSDDFLFGISEANEIDDKENFEIEVYQYVYDTENINKIIDMKQLYFDGKEYSEQYVEYFFDMAFDTEKTVDINYVEEVQKVEDGFKNIQSECE